MSGELKTRYPLGLELEGATRDSIRVAGICQLHIDRRLKQDSASWTARAEADDIVSLLGALESMGVQLRRRGKDIRLPIPLRTVRRLTR